MVTALSRNSVTMSEDSILEFEPETYRSMFFSLDRPRTTFTKDTVSESPFFARTCLPSVRLGLTIE